jgi:hypothetical protein
MEGKLELNHKGYEGTQKDCQIANIGKNGQG